MADTALAEPERSIDRPATRIAALVAVGIAYLTGSLGSHQLADMSNQLAFFWPSGAVLLAALLLTDRARWPAFVAIALVSGIAGDLLTLSAQSLAFPVTPLNVIEVVGIALLMRWWVPEGLSLTTLSGIIKLTAAVICGAAFVAVMGALLAPQLTASDFFSRWLTWFAADALGMLLVTPLIMILADLGELPERSATRRRAEAVWCFGIVFLAALIVFSTDTAPLLFLIVPFVLLATLRLGPLGAAGATLVVTMVAIFMTSLGHGPLFLVSGGFVERVQYLQLYLAVLFVTTLPLSGVLAEREQLVTRVGRNEENYRLLMSSVSDVIYQTDAKGRWTFLNGAWEELTGRAIDDTLGQSFLSAVDAADRAGLVAALSALGESREEQLRREVRFTGADGRVHWAELRATMLRDRRGTPTGSTGTLTDITERKREESRRAAEEARYRAIFDHAVDAIVVFDELGRVRSLNPAAEAMFGHAPGALLVADIWRLIRWPGGEGTPAGEQFDASLLAAREGEGLRADGSLFPVELSVSEWRSGSDRFFTAMVRDVTTRREAERALTESESRYRLLAQNISDAILRLAPDGRCLYASPSAVELAGRLVADLVGLEVTELVEPEDRDIVRRAHQRVLTHPGSSATVRYRYRHPNGRLLWLETSTRSVVDQSGAVVEVISAIRDISERKALEDELVAARDVAQAATAAKSSFLANMSHEIRTPMNGVLGFAEILAKSDLDDEQRRHAAAIVTSGKSLMRLLNDILDLSKIEAGALEIASEPFDLPTLMRQCGTLFLPTAEAKGLELAITIDPGLPRHIRTDSHRLRQIVLNLLGNAVKFTETGAVTLAVTCADPGNLEVTVTDTGIGIPPDRQGAIFGEFEQEDSSTSRRFGGTGLGLSISRRLAELLGGNLTLTSAVGEGTSVRLTVPIERSAAPREALPAGASRGHRAARILLAEDVEINRDLVLTLLAAAGHSVETVVNGAQAVAAVEAGAFDLVLMDVQMPEVDGLEATRRIRALPGARARIPVVALTANAFASEIRECREAGMTDHVTKPIDQAKLFAAIERALAAGPAAPASRPTPAPKPAPVKPVAPTTRARPAAPTLPPALVAKFGAQLVETADLVEAGTAQGDAAVIADACHKLAGVAAVFGRPELGEDARALETALKQGGFSPTTEAMTRDLAVRLREAARAMGASVAASAA